METIDEPLRKIVKSTGLAVQVRLAALRALALSYFICGTDLQEVYHCMDFCEMVSAVKFRGEVTHELLRAHAIECWSLLATVVTDSDLAAEGNVTYIHNYDNDNDDHDDEDNGDENEGDYNYDDEAGRGVKMLPLFLKCLEESSCIELKSACGEAVALTHEARLDLGIGDDEDVNATHRKYDRGKFFCPKVTTCFNRVSIMFGNTLESKIAMSYPTLISF